MLFDSLVSLPWLNDHEIPSDLRLATTYHKNHARNILMATTAYSGRRKLHVWAGVGLFGTHSTKAHCLHYAVYVIRSLLVAGSLISIAAKGLGLKFSGLLTRAD